MKYEYIIYTFKLSNVQEAEEWINRKAEIGFKIINIYYYENNEETQVRYTLEKEK